MRRMGPTEMTDMDVFAPAKLILEYGYAGLCVLLVGVIVWMTRQLLAALRANQQVISTIITGRHSKFLSTDFLF